MKRQLSRPQVDSLVARLREMKITPGVIITSLWQFGWIVPPFPLMPIAAFLPLYLFWVAGIYCFMLSIIFRGGFGKLSFFAIIGPIALGYACRYLMVRSRGEAILAGSVIAAAVVLGGGWIVMTWPEIDWQGLRAAGVQRNIWIFVLAAMIGSIVRYYRQRRKIGRLTWRELVDQVLVAEAF